MTRRTHHGRFDHHNRLVTGREATLWLGRRVKRKVYLRKVGFAFCATMKRGFLLRATEKEKAAAARPNRELQASERKNTQVVPQNIRSKLQLPTRREGMYHVYDICVTNLYNGLDLPPEFRLPYGNLTEQQKGGGIRIYFPSPLLILPIALPEEYDKNKASLHITNRDPERTDISPGETVFTTMPRIDDGDGSTQWIVKDSNAKAKVLETPGYPARTPKPRRPDLYEVRMTPDMGQGVFAKRSIKRGDLIFSERPLLIAPTWFGSGETDRYSANQVQQVMMLEFEKVLEVAVQRMPEKERALFMALYNSHTADGTGPLLGIMRTNSFGVSKISESGIKTYGAVSNLGSRINHRYLLVFAYEL